MHRSPARKQQRLHPSASLGKPRGELDTKPCCPAGYPSLNGSFDPHLRWYLGKPGHWWISSLKDKMFPEANTYSLISPFLPGRFSSLFFRFVLPICLTLSGQCHDLLIKHFKSWDPRQESSLAYVFDDYLNTWARSCCVHVILCHS